MEISEIKSHLTLAQVLHYYHLTPDKNQRLCCPFHEDKTPSLQIYPKTNTWTCFSSNCKAGSGDQIDFIMRKENISKHEALVKAKNLLNINSEIPQATQATTEPKTTAIDQSAILLKYYQGALLGISHSSNARAYAESRHLDWQKLGIGFTGGDIGKSWSKEHKASLE